MTGLPHLLPGEDRTFGAGLFVDLIPRGSWFTNVRSALTRPDWDRVRRMVYDRARHCCEACGQGPLDVQAHERFSYEPDARQVLRRLVALCPACHEATHFGLANVRGHGARAAHRLAAVNSWTAIETKAHIDAAFETWQTRSARTWTLDLTILTAAGLTPAPSADPQ